MKTCYSFQSIARLFLKSQDELIVLWLRNEIEEKIMRTSNTQNKRLNILRKHNPIKLFRGKISYRYFSSITLTSLKTASLCYIIHLTWIVLEPNVI